MLNKLKLCKWSYSYISLNRNNNKLDLVTLGRKSLSVTNNVFHLISRTKQIRWGVVVSHFVEVAAIVFYNTFLWERFILPYWSDFGKEKSVSTIFHFHIMYLG